MIVALSGFFSYLYYNKNCATSKDLSVHPFSMARVLIYPSLDSLEAAEGTCDAQADFSLR